MTAEFLLILAAIVALYFLPTLVAATRDHHNGLAIAVLNLLLGWTALGWIVALIWAFTAVRRDEPRAPS